MPLTCEVAVHWSGGGWPPQAARLAAGAAAGVTAVAGAEEAYPLDHVRQVAVCPLPQVVGVQVDVVEVHLGVECRKA